ncbi:MAG: alpha/beta hydrolase [Gemmatimonadales bacterium]|nr:alpha/beta hydrolase [Gemmatimonadales bacterium]
MAPAFGSDEISVVTRGSGPDVILIHGLAGNIGVWAPSAEALDDHYRLHLVEIHGFGGVARSSTDSLVTAAVAREVARYVREMKLTRPALVGHSMGGTIAMMVAARNPGLVGRVMVVDMVPSMGAMMGQPGATPETLRPVADQMRAQILNGNLLDQMVGSMARSEEHRRMLVAYADSSDRLTVANAMHELILTDMRPEIARIDVPLTVVYVQRPDVTVPPHQFDASMKEMYRNAPNATMVRIDESNHYIQLDQPARFVAAVETFMRR